MSTWREERRRDEAARAEQARKDREAEREFELKRARLAAEQRRRDREAEERRKADRQRRRRERRQALLDTVTEHRVAVAIYGIALVSFVMSAPAMADYGHRLYAGSAWPWTGWLLPVVTELSMWACAFAVHHTRRTTPGASVFWLQVGVALATALAAGLNAMKGITVGWDASVVMGVVSIAGVLLHQMTVAGQPRSREQRDAARIERQIARRERRAREAAIKSAKVEIAADGTATLVFDPGVYQVGRNRKARLTRVVSAVDRPGPRDAMDEAIEALIDGEIARELTVGSSPGEDEETGPGGGVATLDRPAPQSSPTPQSSSGNTSRRGVRLGGRQSRSMDQLRAELTRLVQAGQVDPSSAESIRRGLRCAKSVARSLRDEYRQSGGER